MQTNVIHNQDCIDGMLSLPAGSVDVVVTSPPYNLNIKYGTYQDDLPRENYLRWLGDVFAAVKHCLSDNGHFFLNVGYSNIDPWVGMDVAQVARQHFILQNNFTWVKSIYVNNKTSGHFKPINSKRFVNPTWEHLYHFTKDGNIPIDRLAVGVPYEYKSNIDRFEGNTSGDVRCRGNTWFIPYDTIANREKARGKHPATFPVALVDQCVKLSGKKGIVLDPFMGTGTTAVAAKQLGLDYVGYDIDSDYIEFAEQRLKNVNSFAKIFR